MKYFGLLGYDFEFKQATNVGDYVQSLAAKRFVADKLASTLVNVNREKLNSLTVGQDVFMILNGWFAHKVESWPPSDELKPLFVSFHINNTVKDYFASKPEIINYFKKHEPIGCRDTATRDFLRSKNVDAYFSGCLTTTLNRSDWSDEPSSKNSGVLFIDIVQGKGDFGHLFRRADINLLGKIARLPKNMLFKFKNIDCAQLERQISKSIPEKKIKHLTTQFPVSLSEPQRYALAESKLKQYAEAELVITSRIHVALPCLAFGTSVIFVNPGMDTSRFPGLDSFFNMLYPEQIMEMSEQQLSDYIVNLKNKDEHVSYRNSLIEKCELEVANYLAD